MTTDVDRYTTRGYWEEYYSKSSTDRGLITTICGRYDALWDQLVRSCDRPPKSILEIGAYPGRYVAYIAARYGLEATALDYNSDVSKIEESFRTMGVERFHVLQADFLTHEPTETYDLVISNGFIEHFANYDHVLGLHARYLSPGGSLLVLIPNKRFLRRWYGLFVDRPNLELHNLACMNLETFTRFASTFGMSVVRLGYLGGFAYTVHQKLNSVQRTVYRSVRVLARGMERILAANPSKFWSGTIVFIAKNPEAKVESG